MTPEAAKYQNTKNGAPKGAVSAGRFLSQGCFLRGWRSFAGDEEYGNRSTPARELEDLPCSRGRQCSWGPRLPPIKLRRLLPTLLEGRLAERAENIWPWAEERKEGQGPGATGSRDKAW